MDGGSDRGAVELRFQRHSPFRNQAVDMIAKSEEVKTFLLSAVPVFNFTTGVLTGYRGTATDVTELRKREVGLRVAKEMAEMASRAKTEFLANMAMAAAWSRPPMSTTARIRSRSSTWPSARTRA